MRIPCPGIQSCACSRKGLPRNWTHRSPSTLPSEISSLAMQNCCTTVLLYEGQGDQRLLRSAFQILPGQSLCYHVEIRGHTASRQQAQQAQATALNKAQLVGEMCNSAAKRSTPGTMLLSRSIVAQSIDCKKVVNACLHTVYLECAKLLRRAGAGQKDGCVRQVKAEMIPGC